MAIRPIWYMYLEMGDYSMIMNPVIQGGGTLPEKVNIRYSSVVIYYMTDLKLGPLKSTIPRMLNQGR